MWLSNEELRGDVLSVANAAQNAGALPIPPGPVIDKLKLPKTLDSALKVGNAIAYLTDHGFLESKKVPGMPPDFGNPMITKVTGRGVDNAEGRVPDLSVVQNIQVIGNNFGQAVQHGTASGYTSAEFQVAKDAMLKLRNADRAYLRRWMLRWVDDHGLIRAGAEKMPEKGC